MGAVFFTLQELAQRLKVTTRTMSGMVERGDLKEAVDIYSMGRALRFIGKTMIEKYHLSKRS